MMMALLTGKTALITGGSTGIGLATAKRFVEEGAYVFINGRTQAELHAAVKEIGGNVTGVQGDGSKPGARRVEDLSANDPQFAAAKPNSGVAAALELPWLRLPQIVQTALEGYADRPALGQRAVEFVKDPKTGRTSLEVLPHFETITYRELSDRVGALTRALPTTRYKAATGSANWASPASTSRPSTLR